MNRLARNLVVLAGLAALISACGVEQPSGSSGTAVKASPLEQSFEGAAREYQVPVQVLKGIAFVETRANPETGKSASGGYGIMQLVEREDWNTLQQAAQLTGVDAARLKVDPDANIRGAAAVLRKLADQSFHDYPALDPNDPADFFRAVSLYPGFSSMTLSQDYASDVYKTMESGFSVQTKTGVIAQAQYATDFRKNLAPTASRQDALKEYPGAYQWVYSPNYTSGRTNYTWIVIHTMQGSYSGTISWFQNSASQVSSHYQVRSSDGQITQMVNEEDTAWHAQCYNSKSIGIEHEGYIADPGTWYTDAMYAASAKLSSWSADRHGIPKDRTHFIGHAEIPYSCNTGGHTDPGTGWNWTKYMSLVTSGGSTTTGTLTGIIYSGGNTANRVSGATVTAGGKTVTTGTDGLYTFQLNAGTYTVNVSKSGMSSNSVSRTLTAGATVWGSMEINPAVSTGKLTGKIYAYNAGNPSDTSVAISGATVTCNGQTQTTAADGLYTFTLPPGTYTVNATANGYQDNSVSRQVTSGGTVWGSMGMTATNAPDTQAPQVAIAFPTDGSSSDVAVLTLTGTASDNSGPVSTVILSINGGQPTDVPVTNGAFSQQIKLYPGSNSIVVKTADVAGNVGQATVTATFNAGVSGFVYQAGDESARIPDATVTLLDPTDGSTAATGQTGADGSFSLSVSKVATDYRLVIRANGFISDAETVTVPDDARLTMQVPLTPGEDVSGGNVGIDFTQPLEGSTVTSETVDVYGTVHGLEVTTVTVNGVGANVFDGGGFMANVPLQVGDNSIEVVARGIHDETLTATLHIKRAAKGDAPAASGHTKCAVVPGDVLFALAMLVPALRRRRKAA